MRSTWLVLMGAIALTVAAASPVEAVLNYADDICPDSGGTEFIVDTPAEAAVVENGYNRDTCHLIIRISMNPVDNGTIIKARSILIDGDGVTPLDIINATVGGDIILFAAGPAPCDVRIKNATVKAKDTIKLFADCPGGRVDVKDSSVIASPTLDPFNVPGDPASGFATGGELFIYGRGDVDLQRSDIYGGIGLHIVSELGAITWFCPGPGASGCIDPFAKPFVAETLCGSPPVFPCTVTFNTAADLKAVCFPGTPGRICGGGAKEIRVSAYKDIDISGSTIYVLDHITFASTTGSLLAGPKSGNPSVLIVQDHLAVSVFKTVDMKEADWTAKSILVKTGGGCVAADPGWCIDAEKSTLLASGGTLSLQANNQLGDINACEATMTVTGAGVPILNNDGASPYDPNVRDTAGECAPLGPLTAN